MRRMIDDVKPLVLECAKCMKQNILSPENLVPLKYVRNHLYDYSSL